MATTMAIIVATTAWIRSWPPLAMAPIMATTMVHILAKITAVAICMPVVMPMPVAIVLASSRWAAMSQSCRSRARHVGDVVVAVHARARRVQV